jgi:hypothetical protein
MSAAPATGLARRNLPPAGRSCEWVGRVLTVRDFTEKNNPEKDILFNWPVKRIYGLMIDFCRDRGPTSTPVICVPELREDVRASSFFLPLGGKTSW